MIVGITGTNGAGKGTIVDYLKEKGWQHFSASGLITEEIIKRGLDVNRDSMIVVGNSLREQFGAGYIAYELIRKAGQSNKAIVESIRTIGEVEKLRLANGKLLAVDCPIELRYKRVVSRGSEKDKVDFNKFKEQEELESRSVDINKQNLIACRNAADWVIINDGTIDELKIKVDEWIKNI
jgi:dephospho-CoA kinase